MNDVIAFGGIGNRVNEIINGMIPYDKFDIKWHIDEHMPFESYQIFENLSEYGVTFHQIPKGNAEYKTPFVDYWGALSPDRSYCSYWYVGHCSMGVKLCNISVLKKMYSVVLGSLRAYPDYTYYPIAAHYRGFGDAGAANVEDFVSKVKEEWDKLNIQSGQKLFVLADCNRTNIYMKLESLGIPYQIPMSPPMLNDKDRNDLSAMRLFMSDYLTLNRIKVIVTSSSISTMTDPARAEEARIVHLGKTRDDGNCFFVKHMKESFIK